jgi:hypothetical protein
MRLIRNDEKVEQLRCEFEAMLTVLTARIASAQDVEDWTTIRTQAMQLARIANKASFEVGLLPK